MALTRKSLIVPLMGLLACVSAIGKDKDRPKFVAQPAASYPAHQTISKVTIAAMPYATSSLTAEAFGKLNPNNEGVLPVLVVIENGTGQSISLEHIKVELVTPDRERIEATPAADIKYLNGADRPKVYTGPIPGQTRTSKRKNPLAAWEIEGRAFSARMLAPKDSASGFFYLRTQYLPGCTLYVTGLRDASSGKELFYYEIPLDKDK